MNKTFSNREFGGIYTIPRDFKDLDPLIWLIHVFVLTMTIHFVILL